MLPSKLKVLKVVFDTEIQAYEIPAFRGAIAAKAGLKHVLFHNHLQGGFRYAYPLIQYKRMGRKPAIVCIGEGVNNIHHYFEGHDWSISISDRKLDMKIDRLDMNQFTMQIWDQLFSYRIRNWIALNQKNWQEYQQIEAMDERVHFLERKLIAHIISFAKGISWNVSKLIKLKIKHLDEPRAVRVKGVTLMGFNLSFRCNAFLPNHIGLGKSASLGFGVVRQVRGRE